MNLQFHLTTRSPHLAFRRSCASVRSLRSSTRRSRLTMNSSRARFDVVVQNPLCLFQRVKDQFLIGHLF